jgi:predicted glutamine amidotransferase
VPERLTHCAGWRFQLTRLSAALAQRGTFNGLIGNGHWLFVYATTRLHVLTIVSTEPLTIDEPWQPLQPGQALWVVGGRVCLA